MKSSEIYHNLNCPVLMKDELSASLLSAAIIGALKRIWSPVKRSVDVLCAFDGSEGLYPRPISTAARDLEEVLGQEGLLTENVKSFLDALLNTGLIVRMCEAAILSSAFGMVDREVGYGERPGLRMAFQHLFERYVPSGRIGYGQCHMDGAALYRAFNRAIVASIQGQDGPAAQIFIEDIKRKEFLTRLNAIEQRLKQLFDPEEKKRRTPLEAPDELPIDVIREGASKIVTATMAKVESVNVYGPEMRIRPQIALDDVFISCDLRSLDFLYGGASSIPSVTSSIKFKEFVDTFNKAVVLGDPGGGKSTLANKIALEFCRAFANSEGFVPIVIVVRDFEAALSHDPQMSLLDYISRDLARLTNSRDVDELNSVLRNLTSCGQILAIFDGLDEIVNVANRRKFVEDVLAFSRLHPLCSVLVTSRRVGYDQAPLPDTFDHFELCEMSQSQSMDYFLLLTTVVWRKSQEQARESADEFMEKTGDRSPDLIGNPLMMALMVWLYHERRGALPATRARIYRACAELMFEQWDEQRNISSEIPEGFEVHKLLSKLASEIYANPALAGGVSKDWLTQEIQEHLRKTYDVDRDLRAHKDAELVLDFITGRSWIMTDAGAGVYAFTHRTFLEYFFSKFLNDRCETLDDLFKLIEPEFSAGIWEVPSHLALQERIETRAPVADEVAQRLLQLAERVKGTERVTYVTPFLADALEYLSGATEKKISELAKITLKFAMCEQNWRDYLSKLLKTTNKRRNAVLLAMATIITDKLVEVDRRLSGPLCDWLLEIRYSDVEVQKSKGFASAAELLDLVESNLSFASFETANQDFALAKIRFDLIRTHGKLCAMYGVDVWHSSIDRLGRMNWMLVDMELVLLALGRVVDGEASDTETKTAEFGLLLAPKIVEQVPKILPRGTIVHPLGLVTPDFPILELAAHKSNEIALAALVSWTILSQNSNPYDGVFEIVEPDWHDVFQVYRSVKNRPATHLKVFDRMLDESTILVQIREPT